MKRISTISLTILLIIIVINSCNNIAATQKEKKANEIVSAFDVKNMDLAVKPGDDFFKYVNGTWLKNHPVPADKNYYGVGSELRDKNQIDIREIIIETSQKNDAPIGSIAQKVRDFYNSGMDSAKIESLGFSPIQDILDKINNIKTIEDVQNLSAWLSMYQIYPFFSISSINDFKNSEMNLAFISQSGLGLPEKDYYFSKEPATIKIREAYLIHISKMFQLLGENATDASTNATTIMKIETQLANVSYNAVENHDLPKLYNKMTFSELQKFMPDFNWQNYFTTIGYENIKVVSVGQPPFFKEINRMMKTIPVNDWKIFFKWNVVNNLADYLSSKFMLQNFDFYNKTLNGQQQMTTRWKKVVNEMDENIGEAIGKLYVEKHFPVEAKQKMLVIIGNLKAALKKRITNLLWMSNETKIEALAKLEKMNVKVGYPDKWKDYSRLEISKDNYLANILNSRKFDFKDQMDKVGKKVDRSLWHMTPQTVNAYSNPLNNEIVFPAGILQPPYFNLNADDAINYGAIGVVIGHEITHGFDNLGRNYDKDGNMRDWWTKKDADEFKQRAQIIEDRFNKFEVVDSVFVNGKLTLGENIADFGGLTIAYCAYRLSMENKSQPESIDGFTDEQRFFLSFAQVFRMNFRDKFLRMVVKTNEHTPNSFRVNGTLFEMPEFYAAFPSIRQDDKLYVSVVDRPVIW